MTEDQKTALANYINYCDVSLPSGIDVAGVRDHLMNSAQCPNDVNVEAVSAFNAVNAAFGL